MKILLFGTTGQVAHALLPRLQALGDVTALSRTEAEFSQPENLRTHVRTLQPEIIVNAVAYTAVDRAEKEAELAHTINATAPGVLAQEAAQCGAWLIHYSTDYVFDGKKTGAYVEDDATGPLNVYGRSKLAGEQAIAATGCNHLILRTSWVYSAHGQNFLKTIARRALEPPELRVVDDQFGAPTSSTLIADVTCKILPQLFARGPDAGGLYHLTARGQTSWHGYAEAILEALRQSRPHAHVATLTAVSGTTYPTAATRPANSQLDTSKLRQHFGIALPDWKTGVLECLSELGLRK
ncbi:MAG: dTDP-4-dehydrorhamnose reductase [Burkholderiaceae bacterium]|nr:MAG: dTDP-4-dehydrorhamnose reductase [Burkholderiaceae bacterium]